MILDTCVVINIANGRDKDKILNYLAQKRELLFISGITIAEYLSFPGFSDEEALAEEKTLNEDFIVIDLQMSICREAARLRKAYLNAKKDVDLRKGIADFLIIGTAKLMNQKVFTFDKRLLKMFPEFTETIEELVE